QNGQAILTCDIVRRGRTLAVAGCRSRWRRAFIAAAGMSEGVPSNVFFDFFYPQKCLISKLLSQRHRYSIRRVVRGMGAGPIRRARPHGAIVWKLPDVARSIANR